MCSSEGQTKITVKVSPGASRNELKGFTDGILRVKVAAPPEKDKANKELVAFLSHRLGVSKSSISILKGHTSHNKIIAITGLSLPEINERLFPAKAL